MTTEIQIRLLSSNPDRPTIAIVPDSLGMLLALRSTARSRRIGLSIKKEGWRYFSLRSGLKIRPISAGDSRLTTIHRPSATRSYTTESSIDDDSRKIFDEFERATASSAKTLAWPDLITLNDNLDRTHDTGGGPSILHGYVTSTRTIKKGVFLQVADPSLQYSIQAFLDNERSSESLLASLRPHTPVSITGSIVNRPQKKGAQAQSSPSQHFDPYIGQVSLLQNIEIQVLEITRLNSQPQDLTHPSSFAPQQRHLILRSEQELRSRLTLRSKLRQCLAERLSSESFLEIETPLLFKSTPEGAREYIVPTREPAMVYALPQSPQQYKQALMAGAIPRYFQFAKCFRDEDTRKDRQPEFTQLDLEMAFADSEDVMKVVEDLVLNVAWPLTERSRDTSTVYEGLTTARSGQLRLPVISYHQAMSLYGIDKPDLRWGSVIKDMTDLVPDQTRSMMTDLDEPVIEAIKVSLNQSPQTSRRFVGEFMSLPSSAQFSTNPDGMPAIAIFDTSMPLQGLQTYGFEMADAIQQRFELESGDILIVQARVGGPFAGGSTPLGQMRQRIYEHAVQQGLQEAPDRDCLLWVIDFPLFSPTEADSEGQGGLAGFQSSHHPFTAPKSGQDLALLLTDPLSVQGDHYDLVVNGVEIGGGSRRIHQRRMQELIFRDVLKMSPDRITDFDHLLRALGDGCPPHAGFALGFDRLMTLLTGVRSIRDVIAFPKDGQGRDLFVGSPSRITTSQLDTYHLQLGNAEAKDTSNEPASKKS